MLGLGAKTHDAFDARTVVPGAVEEKLGDGKVRAESLFGKQNVEDYARFAQRARLAGVRIPLIPGIMPMMASERAISSPTIREGLFTPVFSLYYNLSGGALW